MSVLEITIVCDNEEAVRKVTKILSGEGFDNCISSLGSLLEAQAADNVFR